MALLIRSWHRPLMTAIAAMVALALVSVVGMVVDHRTLLGESVWLKPLKFALAFILYMATLCWLISVAPKAARVLWWLGTIFAVTAIVDVGFIAVQAARGTFSHFNTQSDSVNSVGQLIFAFGVPGLFLANLAIAAILSTQRIVDRSTGVALRAGLGLAVVGMACAYLVPDVGKQQVHDASGHAVVLAGGHTVGAPDTAGMPLTHWSTTGGDLRIPHFVGLHGIQVLLVCTWLLHRAAGRRVWLRSDAARTRLMVVAALGYVGLFGVTLWQALRGQPLSAPDLISGAAYVGLAAAVAAAAGWVWLRGRARTDGASGSSGRTATEQTARMR